MAYKDDYIQWFPVKVTAATASNTLAEAEHGTQFGTDSDLAMRVHCVEWHLGVNLSGQDNEHLKVCLCTMRALTTMPNLGDFGMIDMMDLAETEGAAGYAIILWPVVHTWLPPFVCAPVNISMYVQSTTDKAAYQSKTMRARIGYTQLQLVTKGDYKEVYQTWNRS